MAEAGILAGVTAYYAGKLREFGATPRGVDWNSAESQQLRFRQLSHRTVHRPNVHFVLIAR